MTATAGLVPCPVCGLRIAVPVHPRPVQPVDGPYTLVLDSSEYDEHVKTCCGCGDVEYCAICAPDMFTGAR